MSGNNPKLANLALALLAVVFTVALTFATIELPRALNRFVDAALGIPHFHPVIEPDLIEAFMRSNHVRLIGYSCLAVVVVLILAGFVTERTGLSSLGAIAFFLPTFGYFAVYMFFLAGLGILRALWLPFWGDLMKLGDIAYLPYMILVYPFALVGVDVRWLLAFLLIGLGLLVFLLGTLAWFYARLQGKGTALLALPIFAPPAVPGLDPVELRVDADGISGPYPLGRREPWRQPALADLVAGHRLRGPGGGDQDGQGARRGVRGVSCQHTVRVPPPRVRFGGDHGTVAPVAAQGSPGERAGASGDRRALPCHPRRAVAPVHPAGHPRVCGLGGVAVWVGCHSSVVPAVMTNRFWPPKGLCRMRRPV
jgi:hypothetical protein